MSYTRRLWPVGRLLTASSTRASRALASYSTYRPLNTFSSEPASPPFDKILIANRGEIACRVIRTAREMGVKTVAVYSDVDDQAPHARMADEAVCIGPAPALESYLDATKILGAIKQTGAQAVHPGYGFLSENAIFAESCEEAGVTFIGPPSGPIKSMGDKLQSKKIAAEAGVNTIPGFKGAIDSADEAVRLAKDIGYPVMIKASAGGGGKGMRIARDDEQLRDGFARSKAEALSSFGDDRMLLERYIKNGHHIEIQVLADDHGNVAAFPERECSVQRRNQKVLEESPSCLITPEVRLAMQEQAIMLCRATGYRSAGTVEMICGSDLSFYFLEMNTRLQVEHPITEYVTGVDLVEEMLKVAAGRPMSDRLAQHPHVPHCGHAIEARVYAEDPLRNFLPSTGPLITYQEPVSSSLEKDAAEEGIRVDAGVVEGSTVSMFYDPMISKLVAYGDSREEALVRLGNALDAYIIKGVNHNIPFLRDVVRNEAFATGKYSTSFIGKEYPEGFSGVVLTEQETLHLTAAAAAFHSAKQEIATSISGQLESRPQGAGPKSVEESVVVLGGPKGQAYYISSGSMTFNTQGGHGEENGAIVTITPEGGGPIRVIIDALEYKSGLLRVSMDGEARIIQVLGARGEGYDFAIAGSYQHVIVRSPLEHDLSRYMLPPVVVDHSRTLRCPMPGQVISLAVTEDDHVEEGQALAVVEAMKMQNILRAQQKGRVASVKCKAGDTLGVDAVMMEFDFESAEN